VANDIEKICFFRATAKTTYGTDLFRPTLNYANDRFHNKAIEYKYSLTSRRLSVKNDQCIGD